MLERLARQVEELFPGEALADLRKDIIERSFNVPQFGPYHTEGMFMSAHLGKILSNIEDVKAGKMPEAIPADAAAMIRETVASHEEDLKRYAFLHDIAKADCLTVTYEDGSKNEVSWDEWQEMAGDADDPEALDAFCREQQMSGISYYQQEAERKHGKAGAEALRSHGEALDVPPLLLTAVDKHEVAYSFAPVESKKKTVLPLKAYAKHFGDLSDEEMKWVLTASYLDTMASVREGGSPDASNFVTMLDTIYNARAIQHIEAVLMDGEKPAAGLDPRKVRDELQALRDAPSRFPQSKEELLEMMREKCKVDAYDSGLMQKKLQVLVDGDQITAEQMEAILDAVDPSTGQLDNRKMGPIRGQLRAANRIVNAVLEECKK